MVPLAMGWRHLLFENFPVDPNVVAPHLPDAFAVDTFDGVLPPSHTDLRQSAAVDSIIDS